MAEATEQTTQAATTQMEAFEESKNYTHRFAFHSSVDFEFLSEKRFESPTPESLTLAENAMQM